MLRENDLLKTIDGETLLNSPLNSPEFIVSHLIPQGIHLLGGSPKIGKSWLVLWMCLQIANGEPIWNYETRSGTVLYLALEDSFEKLQSRLLEITDEAPSNLHFAILSKSIDDGLNRQIENFIAEHPDTAFIAIDTLQRIRNNDSKSNPYASDYDDLTFLKEIANKNHIAILLVHHLRKQRDDDPLNMLSGSTGLSGAVDTVFVLSRPKRTDNSGNKPKPKSYYFMCSSYRRHKDGDCVLPHRIREIVLDEIVREEINQAIYCAVNEKDKFVECISKRSLSESRKKLSQKITELDRLNNRKNELNVIFRKLYEDNALGKIPDEQYRLLSDSYTSELHELKAKISELQNQINEIKTEESNVDRFIALANKYIYIEELTPEILRTFVSKITIHENDKDNLGAKYDIDIFLTHIGKFW